MSWHVALSFLAIVLIAGGFIAFFRAASYIERARGRRVENEQLKHAALLREEERQSAYAGRVVIRPTGSPIGVAVKAKPRVHG